MRDTMGDLLIHYDESLGDDWEEWDDEWLSHLCKNLIFRYGKIAKYGFRGRWDGPNYGGSIIDDWKTLKGHITQDFSFPLDWRLEFIHEKTDEVPIQRYASVKGRLEVPKNSILLTQYDHDGTSCYILRPVKQGMNYSGRTNFIDWCQKYTKGINLTMALK